MNILLIFVCLIGFIYGLRQRNKINPFSLFFGIWLIISVAASLKLYGLLEAGDFTYTVMLVGCVVFFLGLLFGEKIFSRRRMKLSKKKVEYELNYKLMYVLAIVTIIVYAFYLGQTAIQLLNGHDLGYIRQMAQHGEMYDVPIMNMLRILIAFPFTYVVALVTPTDIFFGKKDKLLIALTVIIMILRILSDGSRSAVVWLLVSALICFLYKRKMVDGERKKISKKNKKLLLLLFLIPVVILIVATISRSGSDSARFTYYYFAMEPKMLENWMGIADQSGVLGFGMAALSGFFFVIFYVITHIFTFLTIPAGYQSVYNLLEGVGTNWQTIAEQGARANSYASTFFTFYVDGRMVGVIIGMLLFGLFAGYYYRKVKVEKTNLLGMSLYNFIMMGIFFSFIQFPLKSPFNAVALVMLLTIVYRRKRMDKAVDSQGDDNEKNKKKILAVAHSVAMSGANKSFLNIIDGLRKKYEVVVLVNAKTGDLIDKLNGLGVKVAHANYSWSYIHPGRTFVKKTARRVRDIFRYTNEFASDELDYVVEGQNFDLIYTNTSVVDVGARLARKYHIPHIWHIREFGEEDFGLIPIRSQKFRNKLLHEAKCVVVISKALGRKYKPVSTEMKVIYNGFQVKELKGISASSKKQGEYKKDEEINILVVGQVTPAKGQEIAALAVEKLIESGWKAKLILVGKVDQDYIRKIVSKIGGNHDWLEIMGEVKNVYELREKADIELVCSRNEAFGRVTIEAMLHRLPVIGSDSGGTAELISNKKTGLLFKAGDVKELYNKILEVLENNAVRSSMIKNAYSFAEGFTMDKTIEGVESTINGVLSVR